MQWYYVEHVARRGPVSDEQFQELVRSGVVGPDTLVWNEGMSDWRTWREVSGAGADADAGTPGGGIAGGASAGAGVGAGGYRTETPTGGDPAALVEALRARGGYSFEIGSVLSRGFDALKGHFLPAVAVILIYFAIGFGLGLFGSLPLIGCLATVAQLVVTGPLTASILLYFSRVARGERPGLEHAFLGFRQPLMVQALLIGLITQGTMLVAMMLVFVPFGGMAVLSELLGASSGSGVSEAVFVPLIIVGGLFLMVIGGYLYAIWTPAYLIAAETGAGFWPSMEASRKIVHQSFLSWAGFYLLCFVLLLVGLAVFCVGYLVAAALVSTAFCVIWEDIRRQASSGPGATGG